MIPLNSDLGIPRSGHCHRKPQPFSPPREADLLSDKLSGARKDLLEHHDGGVQQPHQIWAK